VPSAGKGPVRGEVQGRKRGYFEKTVKISRNEEKASPQHSIPVPITSKQRTTTVKNRKKKGSNALIRGE